MTSNARPTMFDASVVLRDPTSEATPSVRPRVPPPASTWASPVPPSSLTTFQARLEGRGLATRGFAKLTNAKPATAAVLSELAARADVVVEALAD